MSPCAHHVSLGTDDSRAGREWFGFGLALVSDADWCCIIARTTRCLFPPIALTPAAASEGKTKLGRHRLEMRRAILASEHFPQVCSPRHIAASFTVVQSVHLDSTTPFCSCYSTINGFRDSPAVSQIPGTVDTVYNLNRKRELKYTHEDSYKKITIPAYLTRSFPSGDLPSYAHPRLSLLPH
jgi:hypothetical protein